MRITIKQIASELGVSHSTVSRVLNKKQSAMVSDSTRDRILATAVQMGYRPSRLAQALKNETTCLVGIFIPDTYNYFYNDVHAHLREAVEASGYELATFYSSPEDLVHTWERLLGWDLDGIFVFDHMLYVDRLREAVLRYEGHAPPAVGLFSHDSQMQDYVAVDFAPALAELLEMLYAQGNRSLGYVGPEGSFIQSEQRYSICRAFANARDMEFQEIGFPPLRDLREAARTRMIDYLTEQVSSQRTNLPDAIFCQNDEIAIGVNRALSQCGISTPDQVALAGCDDIPYVAYMPVPITSLALPVKQVCEQAWSILQRRIADVEAPPWNVTIGATLQRRASTNRVVNGLAVVHSFPPAGNPPASPEGGDNAKE